MSVEKARADVQNRVGEPPRLTFPDDWTNSTGWKRAQAAPAECGPANAAEFDLLMGYTDSDELAHHRVLFVLLDGSLRAECPCDGYSYRGFCAHVAYLWWRWVRSNLAVTDLDTGQTHLSPPWWLSPYWAAYSWVGFRGAALLGVLVALDDALEHAFGWPMPLDLFRKHWLYGVVSSV